MLRWSEGGGVAGADPQSAQIRLLRLVEEVPLQQRGAEVEVRFPSAMILRDDVVEEGDAVPVETRLLPRESSQDPEQRRG